ncbi:MAG: phage major capsid protein [Gammaproteobacteria bacterium]
MKNKQPTFLMEVREAEFYEGTIATDTPVLRQDGNEEILVMHPTNIELHTKDLPLLENHDQDKQIGIVENIRFVGKKLMAKIRFANDEYSQMLKADVDDKIRQNLSIGYRILDYFYENGKKMVNKFSIHEVSLVPIPADPNSGIGRNSDLSYSVRNIQFKKGNEMTTRKERKEVAEIVALGNQHNMSVDAQQFIENGNSLEQFRKHVLDNISNDEPLPVTEAPMINKGTSNEYSISNAIRGCVDAKYRGFEHEVSQDYQRKQSLKNEHGIIIPTEAVLGKRTMTVGNLGGNVSSISDASKLIPFVQRSGVYASIGLTEFNGFSSDVKIPRGTSVATASFLSLDGSSNITEGTPTMDSVNFSPTSLACFTEVSHKLILQSSVDMDNYLRNLMSESIASKLDLAVIHGSGSSNQPTGMLNATGINTETYSSAIAYADLANALSTLATDGIPLNALAWVVNPAEFASLQVKDKGTDTGQFLLETGTNPDDINQVGTMLGYPCYVSDSVPSGEVLLCRGQHSALGFFGGLELDVNPYQDFQKGVIGIRAIQDFDFQVLNANSICKVST